MNSRGVLKDLGQIVVWLETTRCPSKSKIQNESRDNCLELLKLKKQYSLATLYLDCLDSKNKLSHSLTVTEARHQYPIWLSFFL